MLPALSAGGRLLLIAENLGAVAGVLRALRPDGFALLGLTVGSQRTVLVVRQVALALMAVSLLANLVGNVSLAVLLSQGVLGSTFLAVGLYASGRVVEALLVAALHVAGGLGVRAVQFHAAALRRRVLVTIRFTTVALWVAGSLPLFGILRLTLDGVQSVLAARLEIGAVSLSAGNVVAFGLTLWLALVLARILRALLEDDILPRMALPRGVPSAVSAAVNYAIQLFGFLLAMSAAGLDLGRVTLLAGAFGVGIGFGLQNIVNNFVSGLILLFERPVRIGDVIEVGGVGGTVRHIGIRSSMIRTFEGAELIVPNGNLISERLTNWTFSDYQRRVEMPVGVAYGNDPEQVIALLEGVAAGQPDVLKEPGPQALFLGFGPSSLDFVLRVWTARYDLAGVVRSRLLVALHGALRDAGIEIPFPQQEVHLRRATPPARGPLAGGS